MVRRARATVVAVRREDILTVRVDVKVQANALRITQGVDKGRHALVFRCVVLRRAAVRLVAGIGGRAARDGPLIRPITVVIPTRTAGVGSGLAVLAPQPIVGLGVGEAVRVDDGEDVEVEFVDEGLDRRVAAVARDELVHEILGRHGGDPFAGVHRAVDEHRGLGAATAAAPDVNAIHDAALVGRAGAEDLGIAG